MRKLIASMSLYRKYKFAILGAVLLCTAISSPALTLGRARGAVLLGQPLKLSVLIQAESADEAASSCFEADVFYGDAKQDASRITVRNGLAAGTQTGTVEVIASARVDEPVVTVYLRAGCEHKTTRRYLLLADLASETTPAALEPREPLSRLAQPSLDSPVKPKSAAADSVVEDTATNSVTDKTAKPARKAAPVRAAERVAEGASVAAPTAKSAPAPTTSTTRRPRLKLAPIDLSVERDPTLKLSSEMVVGEGEDLQKRAEAVALWRALNASPQDILNADGRRQSMEADLKSLQAITAKNRQALQEMTSRLQRAESERYLNPVVYGLLAFLLVCGGVGAYAWVRLRKAGSSADPWWRDEGVPAGSGWADGEHTLSPGRPTEPIATTPADAAEPQHSQAPAAFASVDIDLHLEDSAGASQPPMAAPEQPSAEPAQISAAGRASGHADFAHSMNASLRSLNTQEMLDVRQQAEFFMTLGQHDEAIHVLQDSISHSDDSNPLVYLDLLRVLHTLGRKGEYDHYRTEFNTLFSGRVPPYAEFNQVLDGLEGHPDICQHISELWPSEEAVDFIEQCLVRAPGDGRVNVFELEAFRDLLMLHGVALRLVADSESKLMPFSAARASAPSDTKPSPSAYLATGVLAPPEPQESMGTTVDLDLSEPAGNLIDFNAEELGTFKPPTPRRGP